MNSIAPTTPFTRTVIIGSQNSITRTSPQSLGATTYSYSSWSDSGGQTHNVTASASATYTATYTRATGGTTTYISDMTFLPATNGWGPVERDQSNGEAAAGDGEHSRSTGRRTPRASARTPPRTSRTRSPASCTRFKASVGIDDEVGSLGSVIFQVYADATKVYDAASNDRHDGDEGGRRLDPAGASQLRLVVTNGGNNTDYDHADWADARIECGQVAVTRRHRRSRDRTPAPGASGVAASISPTATFSEAMNASTLTHEHLHARSAGAVDPARAIVSYASQAATLNPNAEPAPEHDVHGDRQGRRHRGQGPRRATRSPPTQLELHDGGGRADDYVPQRPDLDIDDERLGPGREGPVERRGGAGRRRHAHPQRRHVHEGPRAHALSDVRYALAAAAIDSARA